MTDPWVEIPRLLREKARKEWEYVVSDVVVYATKDCEPLSLCWPGFREAYAHSEIWIEVLLDIDISGHSRKYIAVIEQYVGQKLDTRLDTTRLDTTIDRIQQLDDRARKVEESMFIHDVKIMEHREQVVFRPLSSVIWLKALNDLAGPMAKAGNGLARVDPDIERDRFRLLHAADVERLVRIEIADHAVWSRGLPVVEPTFKGLKVLVRPHDFGICDGAGRFN